MEGKLNICSTKTEENYAPKLKKYTTGFPPSAVGEKKKYLAFKIYRVVRDFVFILFSTACKTDFVS